MGKKESNMGELWYMISLFTLTAAFWINWKLLKNYIAGYHLHTNENVGFSSIQGKHFLCKKILWSQHRTLWNSLAIFQANKIFLLHEQIGNYDSNLSNTIPDTNGVF